MVNLLTVVDKDGIVHENVNQKIFTNPEAAVAKFGFSDINEMRSAQAEATRKVAYSDENAETNAA